MSDSFAFMYSFLICMISFSSTHKPHAVQPLRDLRTPVWEMHLYVDSYDFYIIQLQQFYSQTGNNFVKAIINCNHTILMLRYNV